ncbi:MAG: hypothetical protein Q8N51_06835, partial [Gammaproteobacteria bacterium]|nr:hypothetical protein [Gammaproteobacteria bacterium]
MAHGVKLGQADSSASSSAAVAYLPSGATAQVNDFFSHDSPPASASVNVGIISNSSSSVGLAGSPLTSTESDSLGYAGQGRAGVLAS